MLHISRDLNGLSVADLTEVDPLNLGFATEKDVREFVRMRGQILLAMREAADQGDYDRIDDLDELYCEVLATLEAFLDAWLPDYVTSVFDESIFWGD